MAIDNLNPDIKYISVDKDGVWAWNHKPILKGDSLFYSAEAYGTGNAAVMVSEDLIKQFDILKLNNIIPSLYSIKIEYVLKEDEIKQGILQC